MNQQTLHGLSDISKTENRLFFIGIGGISMSALAMIAHHLGYCVAGSDRTDSATCARLRAAGIDVAIGHDASHIMPGDVVIYNAAITQDNSEFARAEQMGLRRIYRTDFLAALMVSMMEGATLQYLVDQDAFQLDAYFDSCRNMILAQLENEE